jgi:hypothetical protein
MKHAPFWTISATARALGVGESGTRALDPLLQPLRESSGRRLYDPAHVAKVAAARAARSK